MIISLSLYLLFLTNDPMVLHSLKIFLFIFLLTLFLTIKVFFYESFSLSFYRVLNLSIVPWLIAFIRLSMRVLLK